MSSNLRRRRWARLGLSSLLLMFSGCGCSAERESVMVSCSDRCAVGKTADSRDFPNPPWTVSERVSERRQ